MLDQSTATTFGATKEVEDALPLVSVGLPTYQRAKSLRRAVESVLAQDYPNIELVISDNASTDETEAVCEEYAARDKRVRFIRQDVNRGPHVNFATVLERAMGKYFMWLGDDDWLDSSYVSRCVSVLGVRSDVSMVCGVPTYEEGDKPAFEGVKMDLTQESSIARVVAFYNGVNDNGTFYGLASRDVLLANPTPNVLGGDWLLIASLAWLGKIVTLDDVAVYRSSRGASADVRSLARHLGLSARKARQPHISIAVSVARDIALDSRAYRNVGGLTRWMLASRCAFVVQRRFVKLENPIRVLAVRIWNKGRRLLQRK